MDATDVAPQPQVADDGGTPGIGERMWRKVVAFRRDQEAALQEAARTHPTEPGNASAVIRDAVDAHLQLTDPATSEGAVHDDS